MHLLFIRHGRRVPGSPDRGKPLTEHGRKEVLDLARALGELGLVPTGYVTSTKRHSYETAKLLSEALSEALPERAKPQIIQIRELDTTQAPLDVLDAINSTGLLHTAEIIAIVGHEPSLGQLLMALSNLRHRPLTQGSMICLSADTTKELIKGNGSIEFRWPVVNYQENELREKIRSKVSVATFLAGFTFASLTTVLSRSGGLSWYDVAATIMLTVSLALFIACIYIYDRLSMPEGFWLYGERGYLHKFLTRKIERARDGHTLVWRPRNERKGEARDATLRRHGPLYVYMISTWTIVFTPAVLFGLIGFAFLLLSSRRVLIDVGAGLGILLVTVLYFAAQPDLGYD